MCTGSWVLIKSAIPALQAEASTSNIRPSSSLIS